MNRLDVVVFIQQLIQLLTFFFADDNFLFFRAIADEAQIVKEILNSYERYSWQAVNFQKSTVFSAPMFIEISSWRLSKYWGLGVFSDIGNSRYLGLPSFIGRSKKTTFRYLKDNVFQKIQRWGSKFLSRAWKAVMIRNVSRPFRPTLCLAF